MNTLPTRIIIVDDHPYIRRITRLFLERDSDINVIGETDNGENAVALALKLKPDMVIMDINMPVLNGIDATRDIVRLLPKTKVIGLSAYYQKNFVKGMFDAGACGYVLKDSINNDLMLAIRKARVNGNYISPFILKKSSELPELIKT